ncbi:predicted protein [Postia placenta Mad-698-R]|nr:predicted protein [Postia placenta Mad-698-R]
MSSPDPEIIDLTVSPIPEWIVLDSDGEVAQTEESKTNGTPAGRKPRKRRSTRRKRAAMEDGEIGDGSPGTSADHSRENTSIGGREGGVGEVSTGTTAGSSRTKDTPRSNRSLLDRLTSPRGDTRNGYSRTQRERREGGDTARGPERTPRRDRNQDEDRRRRSRSPRRSRRNDDANTTAQTETPVFFVDVQKTEVHIPAQPNGIPEEKTNGEPEPPVLLLPVHVSVFGEDGVEPVEILAPAPHESDDESYIEYLDYDDDRRAPWMVRYFDQVDEEDKVSKPKTIVCKNCGAEGEHKTYECPVLITCPNRHSSRGAASSYEDCDRCGSHTHNTNECPTLWRLYQFVDDAERQNILQEREGKRRLALGQGGEGYIATDEWCYNCGGCGHLGDDCRSMPRAADAPREYSAFGSYNLLSGPFADASARTPSHLSTKRAPRDWEVAGAFADGYGFQAPMDVGKQGRRKERAKMEKRAREIEEADLDPDDWFGNRNKTRRGEERRGGGGRDRGSGRDRGERSGKMHLELSLGRNGARDDQQRGGRKRVVYDDLPGPSRETDSIQDNNGINILYSIK